MSLVLALAGLTATAHAQTLPAPLRDASGLQLLVAAENTDPTLRVILPGHDATNRSIEIIFPEHVTASKEGSNQGEHFYIFRPGQHGAPPAWRGEGRSLQYEKDFPEGVHFLARAILQSDGVLFHYEFQNRSDANYRMIYAVTDPRLTSRFHDVRLERTYVHHSDGFDLLASETPARLTQSLKDWLPSRYMASFTWPVSQKLVEHRGDGISYYNKSRRVDQPMIATLSTDRKWIVSSFTRDTGNVWSNPGLTCQHVDPQVELPAGKGAVMEVKILVLQGSLDDALRKVISQRPSLK